MHSKIPKAETNTFICNIHTSGDISSQAFMAGLDPVTWQSSHLPEWFGQAVCKSKALFSLHPICVALSPFQSRLMDWQLLIRGQYPCNLPASLQILQTYILHNPPSCTEFSQSAAILEKSWKSALRNYCLRTLLPDFPGASDGLL